MNLDFSKLYAAPKKSGGQRGTAGTPISAPVPASPSVPPSQGTAGDNRRTAGNGPAVLTRPTGDCPPVPSPCPPARGTLKPSTGTVSHRSPRVPPGNAKDQANERRGAALPYDSDSGAPFTPYCIPLSHAGVVTVLAEIAEVVDMLAKLEGWSEERRLQILNIVVRQPASTLAGDLEHFRHQLKMAQGVKEAARAIARASTTCRSY